MTTIISRGELPMYHPGMLILKLRAAAEASSFASFTPISEATAIPSVSPGSSALSMFERAGLIKRVIPLTRQTTQELTVSASRGMLGALSIPATPPPATDYRTGVNIIELERDSDLHNLQIALANDPGVESVSRVPVRYLHVAGAEVAAAPPPVSTMWNLRQIQWNQARALPNFQEATQIRVTVLDSGIQPDHPDLQGQVNGYVFKHPDLPGVSSNLDLIGHGTHVAGTIAASINNNLGINGICDCQILAWKIFDDQPDYVWFRNEFTYFVDPIMYRRALADCVEQGVDVVNLSIGGGGRPDFEEQMLFNSLLANGTTVVASMGNGRQSGSPISYPAAIPGVIAVGATDRLDRVANFSNAGNHISLSAPGVAIWSTLPTYPGQTGFEPDFRNGRLVPGDPIIRETDYDAWQGTSMASPHVAAAAALLLANKGRMSGAQVRTQLMETADKVPAMGGADWHIDYGAGRLNLLKLLS
jgi:subtilisin family serine protease